MKKNSQAGQMVIEMVLLMIVFTAITTSIAASFKENEVVKTLVSGPWLVLSGLLQNGAWESPQNSMALHPNNNRRRTSVDGENFQ